MPLAVPGSTLFPCKRRRRILAALFAVLGMAMAAPVAIPDAPGLVQVAYGASASSIALPPPVDKMLDVILGYPPSIAPGNSPDDPQRPQTQPAKPKTPQNIMPIFLGMPYRQDGIINDDGRYATFNAPGVVLATPGLNCSGLVLAASRIVLEKNITVAEAIRDREGDSGPDAPDGHDWDFGFDLIMNISEGWPRALLAPGGLVAASKTTGKTVPAFDPHAAAFSVEFLPHIRENGFYLVSFSRHKTPDSPPYLHYHTGIIVREGEAVWLYSTTHNSGKVIRHNLAAPEGLARFRESFKNTKGSYKRLTVVSIGR
ncbi:exported hypothetical protein [uncultured delta proteobacterium]|uniref:NlpC/P60 domain-containing protein n=1 Tax=uncultured delta proteobacterium TaxID=34034 RepID=A0A212IZS9_9DELT|nr:exported hypothetical protein [uncultured delta proteobacterium]